MVWSGASESIYSLASAHANDRAGKDDLVALSSSMLFAWSLSGFVMPAIGTLLTALYGTQAFIYVAIAIAVAFCLLRLLARDAARGRADRRDRQLRADVGAGAAAGRPRLRARTTQPALARLALLLPRSGRGTATSCCGNGIEMPSRSNACLAALVRSSLVAKKSDVGRPVAQGDADRAVAEFGDEGVGAGSPSTRASRRARSSSVFCARSMSSP